MRGPRGRRRPLGQAEAADAVLREAGYRRIGLDHYALPGDALAMAAASGRLRRNFSGLYRRSRAHPGTHRPVFDRAVRGGFVQNAAATDVWSRAVEAGILPVARSLPVSAMDELRAGIIERLMCDLAVDVGAECLARGSSLRPSTQRWRPPPRSRSTACAGLRIAR